MSLHASPEFRKIIVPIARHTMNAPDSPLRQAEMNATRAVLLQQTVRRGNLSSPEVEEDKIRCPQGFNDGWVAPTNKVSFRYSFAEMKESVVPAAM